MVLQLSLELQVVNLCRAAASLVAEACLFLIAYTVRGSARVSTLHPLSVDHLFGTVCPPPRFFGEFGAVVCMSSFRSQQRNLPSAGPNRVVA